ncbi:hypothetical protein LZ30DRAFT_356669 [Colletotrichum cereale]|nr:hypothetical protein LZ30DRAFT_356669 [Colletotrichum cereale]
MLRQIHLARVAVPVAIVNYGCSHYTSPMEMAGRSTGRLRKNSTRIQHPLAVEGSSCSCCRGSPGLAPRPNAYCSHGLQDVDARKSDGSLESARPGPAGKPRVSFEIPSLSTHLTQDRKRYQLTGATPLPTRKILHTHKTHTHAHTHLAVHNYLHTHPLTAHTRALACRECSGGSPGAKPQSRPGVGPNVSVHSPHYLA